jgi:hypothetical protein
MNTHTIGGIVDTNLGIKGPIELVDNDVDITTKFTVYGCDEAGYFVRDYRSLAGLKAGLKKINPVHIEAIEQTTTTRESMNIRITDADQERAQCEMILSNKATD